MINSSIPVYMLRNYSVKRSIVVLNKVSITTLLGPDKNIMLKLCLCIILSQSSQKFYPLFLYHHTFENDDNAVIL